MTNNFWWKDAIIYEVYVDKFAGNFRGMAEKLPYLKNLGINCIWILPHYPSPMVDGGYDVSDFMSVRKELGNLKDFGYFIQKAHQMGMRIIVDLVLNHVSIEHPWFVEAASSANNPKRNYFLWSKTGKEFGWVRNPFSHMTEGNWVFHKKTASYYYATFFNEQADLNWDNPDIFTEISKIMDFWIQQGVDGFRLDAVSRIVKKEGTDCKHLPETHAILKKMRRRLDEKYPGVILLAEAGGRASEVDSYFGTGDECHTVFHFELMAKIYLALKRNDFSIVQRMVEESFRISENCQWATFISSHDEITFRYLDKEEQEELLSWLDSQRNYSFTGGAGVAMRLGTAFHDDKEKILKMFNMLFRIPGAPVIYYGSEIGMKNIDLPKPPRDSRLYVRGDFDWNETDQQLKDPDSLLNRVREMIQTKHDVVHSLKKLSWRVR